MSTVYLNLVFHPDGAGRPFVAARCDNPDSVLKVAREIIVIAHKEAKAIDSLDPFIGEVKTEEAQRLERVLKTIVPGLKEESD